MSSTSSIITPKSYYQLQNISVENRGTYLDHNHLDGHMVREANGGSEVLWERHQQVKDGYNALNMNR